MDREGRTPRAGEREKCEADGWPGWDGLMELFPSQTLLCLEKNGQEGSGLFEAMETDTSEEHSQKNVALASLTQVPLAQETTPKPGWHKIPRTAWKKRGIPFPMPD